MRWTFVVAVLLSATSAFASTCVNCHTDEATMKKLVVVKSAHGEEGVG